ncbi:MAG: sensor histidine kinase [Flavisolibacter sp.]
MDAEESRIYTVIIVAVLVLGSILAYFLITIFRSQRRSTQLTRQNIMAEIVAKEKERARIASDLHDELGPLISSVKMKVNSFILSNDQDQKQLAKANEIIDNALKRMREISFDLLPASLLRKGLIPALSAYINQIPDNKLHIVLAASQEEFTLPAERSVHLYRIIQEIIQNTIKHARATELKMEFQVKSGNLIFHSKDNGQGFDYHHSLLDTTGFGLRSMYERTEILKGKLSVLSQKEKGTQYIFEIPLHHEQSI